MMRYPMSHRLTANRDLLNALMSITGGVVGNIQMIEEIFVHLHSVAGYVMEADRLG